MATLVGGYFSKALVQGGAACVLDLPSNRQGLALPWILCPGRFGLWQVPQEGATLEGRTDAVLQVLGPVLLLHLVADGPSEAALVELDHAGTPQASRPGHQQQPGRGCGGREQGAGLSVAAGPRGPCFLPALWLQHTDEGKTGQQPWEVVSPQTLPRTYLH